MRNYLVALITVLSLAFVVSSCDKQSNNVQPVPTEIGLKASQHGPSANGHGHFSLGEYKRHFTFHANTMPNGEVKGNGQVKFSQGGTITKFDIDCINVIGNTAVMSGIVTYSEKYPDYVGNGCWFKVVDNGEGEDAVDLISLYYIYAVPDAGDDCTENNSVPLYVVGGGNIQVKP